MLLPRLAHGPLGMVQAADREIARLTAVRARAVAAFAASRPVTADRPPGQPGAMSPERRAARPEVLAEVSEWAAQDEPPRVQWRLGSAASRVSSAVIER